MSNPTATRWSPLQEQIFHHAKTSRQNLVVQAYAGCGKTTTLLEMINHIPDHYSVFVGAYNAKIAEELNGRVPQVVKYPERVKVRTLHGLGYVKMLNAWSAQKCSLDKDGYDRDAFLMQGILPASLSNEQRGEVLKLMGMAKKFVVHDDDALFDLMNQFECYPEALDPALYVKWVQDMLLKSQQPSSKISFDDMVYLPAALGLRTGQYDYVIIDETQDMNRAQLLVAKQALRSRGTFMAFGDENQCVSVNSYISTPSGDVRASDLNEGDHVYAFRNESIVPQKILKVVTHKNRDTIRVRLASGRELDMTPEHKLWAGPIRLEIGQFLIYLMYREDLGYRVGITNHGYREDSNKWGQRVSSEGADRLWVIRVVNDREEALRQELRFSLKYGIPTLVFEGEKRGLNQERIDSIFQEFGQNGLQLLSDLKMKFEYPHWFSATSSASKRPRLVVNVVAHNKKGTQVTLEGTLPVEKLLEGGFSPQEAKKGRLRVRKASYDHSAAEKFAVRLSIVLDCPIKWRITSPSEPCLLLTASALHPGMTLLVRSEGKLIEERITTVTQGPVSDVVDFEVGDANNFFANGILTHNCIYSFNGANPGSMQEMIESLNAKTLPLSITYRCPKAIVKEANRYVPELEAAPEAPAGKISHVSDEYMKANWKPGDFVISRSNAALISLTLWAMTKGQRVVMEGRDLGGGLIKFVKSSKTSTLNEFLRWLNTYVIDEAQRLEAAGKSRQVELLYDRKEAYIALSEGLTTLPELYARIKDVFSPPTGSGPAVRLMTVHKAKGLEAPRVWLIRESFRPSRSQEEANLYYVAVTRSKDALFIVKSSNKDSVHPEP